MPPFQSRLPQACTADTDSQAAPLKSGLWSRRFGKLHLYDKLESYDTCLKYHRRAGTPGAPYPESPGNMPPVRPKGQPRRLPLLFPFLGTCHGCALVGVEQCLAVSDRGGGSAGGEDGDGVLNGGVCLLVDEVVETFVEAAGGGVGRVEAFGESECGDECGEGDDPGVWFAGVVLVVGVRELADLVSGAY